VSRSLLKDGEYGELLSRLSDTLIEELGADRGFVVVREAGEFRAAAARNFRSAALSRAEEAVSRSIARTVMERGRAVLIGETPVTEPYRRPPSLQRLSLRSVLCAPLVASDEAFALVYLENREVTSCLTEKHRDLLDEVCALAAPRIASGGRYEPGAMPRGSPGTRAQPIRWNFDGRPRNDAHLADRIPDRTIVRPIYPF
jgi:GAF domain-containing protein